MIKTLLVPDCRLSLPAFSDRVQTKLLTSFSWESDSGTLIVYKGLRS